MTDHSHVTDDQLAASYVQGDNKAFDELLTRHKDRIYNYILFMVKNRDLADDLFQDTFVKVIVHLQEGRYHDTGRFSFWLSRIAHNAVMDHFRASAASPMMEQDDDTTLSRICGGTMLADSYETALASEQALRDARRLMDNLPELQREVIYMRLYQGVPFKEIAELTGVSIGTALGRMRYAVLNMRKMAARHGVSLG